MAEHILSLSMAAKVLHPVSREQVEQVWRGGWMFAILLFIYMSLLAISSLLVIFM